MSELPLGPEHSDASATVSVPVTRVFIELQYDGRAFHGWQRQPEARSVQSDLEEALSTLLRHPIAVMGCGRTDAGVHASYFVAHADVPDAAILAEDSGFWERLTWKLNGLLCAEIAILGCGPVPPNAHARFDAHTRKYTYHLHTRKDPMCNGFSARVFGDVNLEAMQEAAQQLVFRGDFASFCKAGGAQQTTICDVRSVRLQSIAPHRLQFDIEADRYLRNMIRAIMGTLLEIGLGKQPVAWMSEVIAAKDRSAAGRSAPADGLFLSDVQYSPEIWRRGGTGVLGGVKP